MGIVGWLRRRSDDPTKDWAEIDRDLPVIDRGTFALGSLKFGDRLEAARMLGRPDACRSLGVSGSWALTYTRLGFELCFDDERLIDARFLIGYGGEFSLKSDEPKASPRLSNGERLTSDTRRENIIRCFGQPEKENKEDDGTTLFYPSSTVSMELELNTDGKLATWHLYRTR